MVSNYWKMKYLGKAFRGPNIPKFQNACKLQNYERFSQCIDSILPVTGLMEEFDSLMLYSEKYGLISFWM